ncbi:MAG: winged helix-turn-helix domain-containing protein [Lysobacterales bacterium]
MNKWTLFSNHGHVLVCLARDNGARLRDVAAAVGITERAVQKIVRDLQESGMVSVRKQGRRNHYDIHPQTHLRHDLEAHCKLADLLRVVEVEQQGGTPDQIPREPSGFRPEAGERSRPEPAAQTTADASGAAAKAAQTRQPAKAGSEEANDIEKKQGSLF